MRGPETSIYALLLKLDARKLDTIFGSFEFTTFYNLATQRHCYALRVGDVTAGQVLVSMADAEGKIFKRSRSMMDKDAIMFALGEEEYALVLKRIVNRLVGSDHVTFEIVDKGHYRPDVIAALMRRVAADSGIYVRDGVDYSMTHFHDLLRAQVAGYRGKRPSPEKFLEDMVKSGRFGEESHIKRGDGTTVTPKEWLTAELARVRRDLR